MDIWKHSKHYLPFLELFNSPCTRDSYRQDIRNFLEFIQKEPKDVNTNDVISYRDSLKDKAPGTIYRKLSSLKSYFKWCVEKGICKYNPVVSVRAPKLQVKTPTQAFSDEEVRKMIAAAETSRDELMLKLMFYLGLRRFELINIKENHISLEGNMRVLTIQGKGNKFRRLPLNDELWNDIQNHGFHNKLLFWIGDDYVYRMVKRLAKKIGIARNVSPHSCRATAISHLLDTKHVPLRDVADFAGHSSVVTTMLYDKKRDGLKNSAALKVGY